MKQGVYLFSNDNQVELVVLINNWWDCYDSKWEKTKISKTEYYNIKGERVEQRTSSVESVFESMEYLGKL
jgi:hypothetical protein